VIIDCQPDYNNLTLNALNAADVIITPVVRDIDSFNAAVFLGKKISLETDKISSWFLSINGYDRQYRDAKGGRQKDFIEMYKKYFTNHLTQSETWFPWIAEMNDIKDRGMPLSVKPINGAVHNPKLYSAVVGLAGSLIEEDTLPWAEVF
jgi:hypothetical protein